MSDSGKTVSNDYTYTNDRLTEVSHNAPNSGSVSFSFTYNGLGWLTETKVGNQSLSTYDLAARTGLMNSITYGNGQTISYTYDELDRLKKVSQSGAELYSYEYDNSGNIGYQEDSVNGREYWYSYDSMERLGKVTSKDSLGNIDWSKYGFDSKNNMTSFIEKIGGTEYSTSYTYDNNDRSDTAVFGANSFDIDYDSTLGIVTNIALKVNGNTVYNTTYGYAPGDGTTSTKSDRVQTVTNGMETLTYTYDERGLITQVQLDANNLSQYRYDALGELVRENYKWGTVSYTMVYAYDVGGNITSKTKYNFVNGDGQVGTPIDTVVYTYDVTWKDKLASYNGVSITYDEIGNPLTDGTWEYTWTQGRRLQQITDGATTVSYKYDSSGIRTEKTVNGTTTKYNVIGEKVTWEKTGNDTPIYYIYDSAGKLWGLKYTDGNMYFYARNLQGDIIKIINSSGTAVVEYAYDAWGNIISTTGSMASTLGADNPFRFKGYYFDSETDLYYLNQRYYNPEWGRFINADNVGGVTGGLLTHNVFAYCANNPVIHEDPDGDLFNLITAAIGAAVGAVVSAAVEVVGQVVTTGKVDWVDVGIEAASGALYGGLIGSGVGVVALAIGKPVIAATTSVAHSIHHGDSVTTTVVKATGSAVASAFIGKASSAVSGVVKKASIFKPLIRRFTNYAYKTASQKLVSRFVNIAGSRALRGLVRMMARYAKRLLK